MTLPEFNSWLHASQQQLKTGYIDGMHANVYRAAPGVNASALAGAKTAIRIRQGLLEESGQTYAKNLGTGLHLSILQPDMFDMESGIEEFFVTSPTKTFDSKGALAVALAHPDKLLVDPEHKMLDTIRFMRDAIFACPEADDKLRVKARRELAGFAWDEENRIMRKTLQDLYPDGDANFYLDIKSCESVDETDYWLNCWKWGNDMKAAYYADTDAMITGKDPRPLFFHIAVTKEEPYEVRVFELAATSPSMLEEGRRKYKIRLHDFAHAARTNQWDSYYDPVGYCPLTANRPFANAQPA